MDGSADADGAGASATSGDLDAVTLPDWMDRERAGRIAQLRAMGYTQQQIADDLGVSQQTVSRYLKGIREAASESGNKQKFFLALVLGGLGAVGLLKLLRDADLTGLLGGRR